MVLSHELPIYKDTYKLILLIFEHTKHFAREYKYTLGQDMKRDAICLVRSIYRANRNSEKRQYPEEFLDNEGEIKFIKKNLNPSCLRY